jgi:hypothetical protein
MGGLVAIADYGTHDVGIEERRLDFVEGTESASPETEHLASMAMDVDEGGEIGRLSCGEGTGSQGVEGGGRA